MPIRWIIAPGVAVLRCGHSGRLDPITPPGFGEIAVANLSNAFHVIHESSGHGATLQSTCGQQNLFTFLTDPATASDTSCAASISGDFVVGNGFAARPIPVERIRAELRLAPKLPVIKGASVPVGRR